MKTLALQFGQVSATGLRAQWCAALVLLGWSLLIITSAAWSDVQQPATSMAARIAVPINVQATALEQPEDYFVTLLLMALNASKREMEDIDIIFSERDYTQARWINLLENRSENRVIWTMTSKEREERLRPIRIPLAKGLFSYRVCLIRKGEQARFDQVQSLAQLAQLVAGQGAQWPDTNILLANQLPVTTSESVDSLFRMLKAKRYDYFPRGVSEAWFELQQRQETELQVEENILLYYPAPIYFFVNKNNEALAQRIEQGLAKIIANGDFDRFFYRHARIAPALKALQAHPRRLFELTNPDLPADSLVGEESYWLHFSNAEPPAAAHVAAPQGAPGSAAASSSY